MQHAEHPKSCVAGWDLVLLSLAVMNVMASVNYVPRLGLIFCHVPAVWAAFLGVLLNQGFGLSHNASFHASLIGSRHVGGFRA